MKTPDQIAEEWATKWRDCGNELTIKGAIKAGIIEGRKPLLAAIVEWNNAANERDDVHLTSDCSFNLPCDGCKRLWDAEAKLGDLALESTSK